MAGVEGRRTGHHREGDRRTRTHDFARDEVGRHQHVARGEDGAARDAQAARQGRSGGARQGRRGAAVPSGADPAPRPGRHGALQAEPRRLQGTRLVRRLHRGGSHREARHRPGRHAGNRGHPARPRCANARIRHRGRPGAGAARRAADQGRGRPAFGRAHAARAQRPNGPGEGAAHDREGGAQRRPHEARRGRTALAVDDDEPAAAHGQGRQGSRTGDDRRHPRGQGEAPRARQERDAGASRSPAGAREG